MSAEQFPLISDLLNGQVNNGTDTNAATNGTAVNGNAVPNGTGLNGHAQCEESPCKFGQISLPSARLTFTSY